MTRQMYPKKMGKPCVNFSHILPKTLTSSHLIAFYQFKQL